MNAIVRYIRIRDVKNPQRGTLDSSGIDFFIPNDLERVKETPNDVDRIERFCEVVCGSISIQPGRGILIPTGIKTIIKSGYDMVFDNKSGIAVKKGLIIGAKVIDADYRGEIHIHLINSSDYVQFVKLGDKVAQAIIREVVLDDLEEIEENEFDLEDDTERGEGGFGSTGN
ncbi:MAG: hypothetical protein PHN31_01705 [Candidatus Gracilibacteria bacterium]|nr:hypothetical protein [Candidatus Gracilibacteria bacterium]